MNNFEKYNALHTEVMKRLEDGEITIETAKAVIDLTFDKYIIEASTDDDNYCLDKKIKLKFESDSATLLNDIRGYINKMTPSQKKKFNTLEERYNEIVNQLSIKPDNEHDNYERMCDSFHSDLVKFLSVVSHN